MELCWKLMVLYFIRKVHVFLQFSEKEYALLINFFSYQRNHTSFHQNPGQAEHFNAVTVIFNFFFNYLNQLHATKSFCYRRSTLAVIREDSSMSSWHSYNYWRRSLLKIPFSTLVEVFDVHAITLLLVDGGWNLSTEEVIWLFGYDFPENYMFHDGWLLPFKIHLLVIPIMSW